MTGLFADNLTPVAHGLVFPAQRVAHHAAAHRIARKTRRAISDSAVLTERADTKVCPDLCGRNLMRKKLTGKKTSLRKS
jgi:hypothetical protein